MMLYEPSVRVGETATQQLEERQSDWAYSKPAVALDVLCLWELRSPFCLRAPTKILLCLLGFGLLGTLFHMVCVAVEYRRRRCEARTAEFDATHGWETGGDSNSGSGSDAEDYAIETGHDDSGTSVAKHLESANTMFSFIRSIVGFYW